MSSVLVVDDESGSRDALERALQIEGYHVRAVATGAAALAAATDHPPDLVVLDPYRPDMHGLEVIGLLVATHPGLTVLIVSAAPDTRSRVDALDTSAHDFLLKPYALPDVLARIRSGLSAPAAAPAHRPADHPAVRLPVEVVTPGRQRSLEQVGQALERLRDSTGTAAVDAAIDQAEAAIADTEPGRLTEVLHDLLVEIRQCQRAGQMSSPELEATFRTAAAALAHPHSRTPPPPIL